MVEQPRALEHPWLDPAALTNLLDELRAEGYNIGVDQYIAVNDLVLALAARGASLDNAQRLKSFIGPLLCSSPSEQETFQLHFDAWLARLGQAAQAPTTELASELATIDRGSRRRRLIIGVGVVAAVVSVVALVLSIVSFLSALPSSPSGGSGGQPPSPVRLDLLLARVLAIVSRQSAVIALFALLAGFVGWRLWLRYRANLFLARRTTTDQPEISRVALAGLEQQVLPPLLMFHVARDFRRRVEAPSDEIDIEATIAHTLDRSGWLTPIYRRRLVPPEYLVLIDRAAFGDHQAHLATEMVAALAERDVIVSAYYFDGDPRVCIPARLHSTPRTLRELADESSHCRLIVFADARNLFSLVTGHLEPWTETFARWPDRALLTPEPPSHWGHYERELAEQFVVLPSNADGLSELIRSFERREPYVDIEDNGLSRLPEELRLRPRRWLGRAAPSIVILEQVLEQLRSYLGASGYSWLSACAVYPAIQWNLTLYLGSALSDTCGAPLIQTASLLDLARLPWFRHGTMPDWLRARLIDDMTPEQERSVRACLAALLATAAEGGNAEIALEIARQSGTALDTLAKPLLRRLARDTKAGGPLRDYVFLNFVAGRRQRLAVRAPTTLRSLVAGDYRGMTGWQLWLRWTFWNAVAWALGGAVQPLFQYQFPSSDIGPPIWVAFCFGLIGGAQWWVLRRYRLSLWRWVIGQMLGMGVYTTIGVIFVNQVPNSFQTSFVITFLILLPLLYAGLQWMHMIYYIRSGWKLFLGSSLGLVIGIGIAVILGDLLSPRLSSINRNVGIAAVCAIAGALYGGVSGSFLLRILRRWRQPEAEALDPF